MVFYFVWKTNYDTVERNLKTFKTKTKKRKKKMNTFILFYKMKEKD